MFLCIHLMYCTLPITVISSVTASARGWMAPLWNFPFVAEWIFSPLLLLYMKQRELDMSIGVFLFCYTSRLIMRVWLGVNETLITLDLWTRDGILTACQRLTADVTCWKTEDAGGCSALWVNEVHTARTAAENSATNEGTFEFGWKVRFLWCWKIVRGPCWPEACWWESGGLFICVL